MLLAVYSSGGTSQLAQLSGTSTGTYSTTTNSAQIVFSSDGSVTYTGWQLYYYATAGKQNGAPHKHVKTDRVASCR